VLAGQVARAGEPPTNVWMISNALSVVTGYTNDWSVYASSIVEIRLAEGGRMTRPVETVCIATNVTPWNNESGCTTCDMLERAARSGGGIPAIFHPQHFAGPYTPATEKTETTEVVEIKTLRFKWDGEECVVERKRVLSKNVRRWVRKDDWSEE